MISVLIICRGVDANLISTITSVCSLKPQILVDISTQSQEPLGVRKQRLIDMAANDWVLILDTDEIVSPGLVNDIKRIVSTNNLTVNAYLIPYKNIFINKHMKFGGETYAKTRLFLKKFGVVSSLPIHEEIIVQGKVGLLKNVIEHKSYQSLIYTILKFTRYAWQMAGEKKKAHESVTLKKLFMYGPHMVWARAVKDEGWRDGWRGIVIALCFGYMETLTYWLLLWRNIIG